MNRVAWLLVLAGMLEMSAALAAELRPAPGFYRPGLVLRHGGQSVRCPPVQVFGGALNFPSKYEGDDSSRDDVNPDAIKEYESRTKPMKDLQQFSAQVSDRLFKGRGNSADLECLLTHWRAWASQKALLGKPSNHVGNAVRKWSLASFATSYLKLKLNLGANISAADQQLLEGWLAALATQVQQDYQGRGPDKANNHDYWAAWSVMVTAVVLQRQDLFDWSYGVYQMAMRQVTDEGYLPNELRRKTRALAYHSFALLPLSTMAAFAQANHQSPLLLERKALQRVAAVVLVNLEDPESIEEVAGAEQVDLDFEAGGRLAWLAPYESIVKDPALLPLIKRLVPLKSSSLGGDQSFIYLRDRPEIYPDRREIK